MLEGEFDWSFLDPLFVKSRVVGSQTIAVLYSWNGFEKMRASLREQGVSGKKAGRMWAAIDVDSAVLDFMEREASAEEREAFWENLQGIWRQDMDEKHAELVAERLIEHERPYSAINMFWYCDLEVPELRIGLLQAARRKYPADEANGFQFRSIADRIEDIFEKLYPHLDAFHAEIAQLEFAFLPLLDNAQCLGLRHEIAHNPAFFHEMLCATYLADDGQNEARSEEVKRLASQCLEFFWNHRYIPGMGEEGIDVPVFRDWLAGPARWRRTPATGRPSMLKLGNSWHMPRRTRTGGRIGRRANTWKPDQRPF